MRLRGDHVSCPPSPEKFTGQEAGCCDSHLIDFANLFSHAMFTFHQPPSLVQSDAVRRLTAILVVELPPLATGKFNFLDTEAMEAHVPFHMVSKGHSLIPLTSCFELYGWRTLLVCGLL